MNQIDEIKALIASLEDIELFIKKVNSEYAAARAAAIPFDVQATLDDVDAEFAPMIASAKKNMSDLEESIGALVVLAGETVKGKKLSFRYNDGKESYDTAMLDGLALVIPKIKEARKKGKPYVSVIGKDK